MTSLTASQEQALEPLRAFLLTAAHHEAAALLAAASAEAHAVTAAAQDAADDHVAHARAAGEEDAADEIRRSTAMRQRARRSAFMAVRRRLYDETREQARDAVRLLLAEPPIRAAVSARLRQAAGENATIRSHADGGLVAEAGDGRRAIASVDALVDEALAGLALDRLWRSP